MLVDRLLKVALAGSTWVLWLLLALSVLSLTAMLERWLFFRRHSDDIPALRARLSRALATRDIATAKKVLEASKSIEARVLLASLAWEKGGPQAVQDAVESELGAARKELDRGTNLLGTLGTNAPFVGLFGTVLGVIEAFHQLAAGAAKAAMGNVMSGIAEALVATGVGLFVALPAVVAYNVAQKRISGIESDTLALAKLLTAALRMPEETSQASSEVGSDAQDSGERPVEQAAE
ncbi:MAG: MotA/TolQ/ExbB proton channel family protein [Myxococcaceae bacterium]|nr:MotA/TolQ/ExbB proton channel family protein [Myxococcaceae bacterium]